MEKQSRLSQLPVKMVSVSSTSAPAQFVPAGPVGFPSQPSQISNQPQNNAPVMFAPPPRIFLKFS